MITARSENVVVRRCVRGAETPISLLLHGAVYPSLIATYSLRAFLTSGVGEKVQALV